MKIMPMRNSRAAATPMPAPTPAAKWLVDGCEVESEAEAKVEAEVESEVGGEAEAEVAGKKVGKGGVEDTKELEVVVVASVDGE